jgi:haloalkane dehalogenase
VREIVTNYATFLHSSPIPKLFIRGNPGSILQEGNTEVEWCRQWANQHEIEVPGRHFLPEDSADEIGEATRHFLLNLPSKKEECHG